MRKRPAHQPSSIAHLPPTAKRPKPAARSEPPRQDPVPQWLHDAATNFVASTPALTWTGGFYSWGMWLDHLRQHHLWTTLSTAAPPPPWRALIDSCRASHQVHGTAALYRAKSDLVTVIINLVYRKGEQNRLANPAQSPAAERDIMRRVRAVVTRQKRHESVSLTLIRFLDFAFVFSAYKDCKLAHAADQEPHALPRASDIVESELSFFSNSPTARDIRQQTLRMQSFMWQRRWLPWYERLPGVPNESVLRAREAALSFCDGLPYPQLHVRAGVRGLSRDHLAGAGSMNDWLLTLFDPSFRSKWAQLSTIWQHAVGEKKADESLLLEETSQRVVETVLTPLTEVKGRLDPVHSKLVDATPGIVVTQSVRISGRFTFRQLLELHINLVVFAKHLHSYLYGRTLPSIEQIHSVVAVFEDIRCRLLDVRMLIESEQVDALFNWCLSITNYHSPDTHPTAAAHEGCVSYQRNAIKAALRTAVMSLARNPKDPLPQPETSDGDPLAYAAIVAHWDLRLAAKIVDAAVRITREVRERYMAGKGDGLDLYTHRRVLVCDAATETFSGDVKAAARIMTRLHPVWEVCEADKAFGSFDERGVLSLKISVDKGNFEAAAALGILLCSDEWEERRKACRMQRDIEGGLLYICKAVSVGDTAAAGDLVHLLQASCSHMRKEVRWELPQRAVDHVLECLRVSSIEEPSVALFLGYVYSLGAPGIPADCDAAIDAYQKVLRSSSNAIYQAYAANNIGALMALKVPSATQIKDYSYHEYFRAAALAGNKKAESNLAAVMIHERREDKESIKLATEIYQRCFKSPRGNSPVTVIQTDRRSKEMNIFEMMVSGNRQMMFCEDLKAEGMMIEKYGEVLRQETLPCLSTVSEED